MTDHTSFGIVPSSTMSDDTASSLRAAALLSLKSNKRRGTAAPALVTPTTKDDAVSLPYDDTNQAPVPAATTSAAGLSDKMQVDQADMDLEDGEISDSNEDLPTTTDTSTTTPTPSIANTNSLPPKPVVSIRVYL